MRQSIKFTAIYPSNKLYAWSREHNIVFAESQPGQINFGREQDLTVFLLTWPYKDIEFRIV